jgi:hypothetical protein
VATNLHAEKRLMDIRHRGRIAAQRESIGRSVDSSALGVFKIRADSSGVLSDLVFGLFQVEVGS